MFESDERPRVFWTYVITSIPGWILTAIVVWFVGIVIELPFWLKAGAVVFWIVKDLLQYPLMRRFFVPHPSGRRIVGKTATATTRLVPRGFVRVDGELWQAELVGNSTTAEPGTELRVIDLHGLLLHVEPLPPGER